MLQGEIEQFISAALFQILGKEVSLFSLQSVGGGCINNGLKITSSEGNYFLKWNKKNNEKIFLLEKKGIDTLKEKLNFALNIPSTIGEGEIMGRSFLLLEWIESAPIKQNFWETLGIGLSQLHQNSHFKFGLSYDNFIGSLKQINIPTTNWIDFFIEKRLEVQLGLAIYNEHISIDMAKKFRYLYAQLPGILSDEKPSLIHGDLWSGNIIPNQNGLPCLIDPAIYYANREIEISFTKLFGSFDQRFYDSYHDHFPLQPGFKERVPIYNLYPLLVHLNLFGKSYLNEINNIVRKYQ